MDISKTKVSDMPFEAASCNSANTCESSNCRSEPAGEDFGAADISRCNKHEDHPNHHIGRQKRKRGGFTSDYLRNRYSIQDKILCQGGQGTIKRAYDNFS